MGKAGMGEVCEDPDGGTRSRCVEVLPVARLCDCLLFVLSRGYLVLIKLAHRVSE